MVTRFSNQLEVGQLMLKVADLEKMMDFYVHIIGLRLLEVDGNKAYLAPHDSDDVILVLKELSNGVKDNHSTGLYHMALLLPTRRDLANTILWLIQENVKLGAADHGYSEAIYLSDPEGNGIEIYWDKPIEEWDIRDDGKIEGITDELNFNDLIKESDGTWLGIPTDAKVGHVHLKVSNLEETENFYISLGFELKSDIVNQAKFFASGNYHHQIGTNVWSGKGIKKIADNQYGLDSYMFILPTFEDFKILKSNLEELGIRLSDTAQVVSIVDPNGMVIKFVYVG